MEGTPFLPLSHLQSGCVIYSLKKVRIARLSDFLELLQEAGWGCGQWGSPVGEVFVLQKRKAMEEGHRPTSI